MAPVQCASEFHLFNNILQLPRSSATLVEIKIAPVEILMLKAEIAELWKNAVLQWS